jgi:membrane-associated protease RseP (regulator of RpoE activity)
VERSGSIVELEATLGSTNPVTEEAIGFLGVRPTLEDVSLSPIKAAGLAGETFWMLVTESVKAIGRLVHPASLADLGGALFGDTEVADEIRPVSPIGLVQIGSQAETVGIENLVFVLASVNVILGLFNVIPLYPLDGGHFAVALYERITRREADVRRLAPVAAAVIALMLFLGVVAIILDLSNPISL